MVSIPATQAQAEGAPHIGRVLQMTGKAYGKIGDKKPVLLVVNGELYSGEVLTTEKQSALTIKFRDGATFSIGAEAKITLDKFVFSPLASKVQNTVRVTKGAFRYTSGFKVKAPTVRIKSPRAVIGVRGTVAEGFVDPSVPMFFSIPKGHGTLSNEAGEQDVVDGQAIATTATDKRPSTPEDMPAAVAAQTVQFIQQKIGKVSLEGTPLTEEQRLADARANQASLSEQTVRKKKEEEKGFFEELSDSVTRWLIDLLQGIIDALDETAKNISFVSTASAAADDEAKKKISPLIHRRLPPH